MATRNNATHIRSSHVHTCALTSLAMIAFACNSILCRLALKETSMDAASFTLVRLVSGTAVLYLITRFKQSNKLDAGSWASALALFVYAAGFSFAYISLPAATGALLLFGAVQATMIGYGIHRGERLKLVQILGLLLAISGVVGLLLPGLTAPPLAGAFLMLGAGAAWGIYSLRGRRSRDPISATASNFLYAVPASLALSMLFSKHASIDHAGLVYAMTSGAITSGIGYAIWYRVLPELKATHAATVQLGVPILAALGGMLLLGEPASLRLVLASLTILGGIALVIFDKNP